MPSSGAVAGTERWYGWANVASVTRGVRQGRGINGVTPENSLERRAEPTFHLTPWDDDGRASLSATGDEATTVLAGAMAGILAAARGVAQPVSDEQASVAQPIRADGADLAALFGGLADSLIGQLDITNNSAAGIRIDGLLRTDEGLTAWGYLLGGAGTGGATLAPMVEDGTTVEDTNGILTLRATLQRGDRPE